MQEKNPAFPPSSVGLIVKPGSCSHPDDAERFSRVSMFSECRMLWFFSFRVFASVLGKGSVLSHLLL